MELELSQAIEAATRQAFIELINRCGEEKIYAFALYTDEDAITLCPAANTLEYLQAKADDSDMDPQIMEPVINRLNDNPYKTQYLGWMQTW